MPLILVYLLILGGVLGPLRTPYTNSLSHRWKVLIIRDLLIGTKRFNELKKSVQGVSKKVLTSHLRDMESDGLVDRKVYAQVPPRVEYSLAELGLSLQSVLRAMEEWGKAYRVGRIGSEDG